MDKRKLIQFFSMLIYNADVKGFVTGTVSRSKLKNICVPGLNCYSCPGAVASCPLGALQNSIGGGRFPFFVTGFLLLIGVLIGRAVCAFLCPFGLIQELLYKIPSPKLKKNTVTRKLSLLKYPVLFILVIALPFILFLTNGIGLPAFCAFLCPAGTLEAGWPLVLLNTAFREIIGFLFYWKSAILVALIAASVFIFRPFCRFLCPLGAIYSFFNSFAVFGVTLDKDTCIHCRKCTDNCKMDTVVVNDHECIRCGECVKGCPVNALNSCGRKKLPEKEKKNE
ncbi:4Fe-4S binding protein [Brucepastera parasyntrophica]|uniref:4Fe-4S binding protein n=1 Tax=Brucepastera parasyntrophica TaxID=2880008 RepID=UPI002109D8D3|nr:4Fe-4S binding protein [Brucepastera parasyntrophica]ULQ59666.1 4Fe-4S binding protein [Brucepastera parasyntrophica]